MLDAGRPGARGDTERHIPILAFFEFRPEPADLPQCLGSVCGQMVDRVPAEQEIEIEVSSEICVDDLVVFIDQGPIGVDKDLVRICAYGLGHQVQSVRSQHVAAVHQDGPRMLGQSERRIRRRDRLSGLCIEDLDARIGGADVPKRLGLVPCGVEVSGVAS